MWHWAKLALPLAFALLSLASLGAANRGVTPEDYFAFKNVTDARLSPDGKLVAYVVTSVDAKRNRRESQIWMIPRDGSRPALAVHHRRVVAHAALEFQRTKRRFVSARPSAAGAARPRR